MVVLNPNNFGSCSLTPCDRGLCFKKQKGFGSAFIAVLKLTGLVVVLWWHLGSISRNGGPFFRQGVCAMQKEKVDKRFLVCDGWIIGSVQEEC